MASQGPGHSISFANSLSLAGGFSVRGAHSAAVGAPLRLLPRRCRRRPGCFKFDRFGLASSYCTIDAFVTQRKGSFATFSSNRAFCVASPAARSLVDPQNSHSFTRWSSSARLSPRLLPPSPARCRTTPSDGTRRLRLGAVLGCRCHPCRSGRVPEQLTRSAAGLLSAWGPSAAPTAGQDTSFALRFRGSPPLSSVELPVHCLIFPTLPWCSLAATGCWRRAAVAGAAARPGAAGGPTAATGAEGGAGARHPAVRG